MRPAPTRQAGAGTQNQGIDCTACAAGTFHPTQGLSMNDTSLINQAGNMADGAIRSTQRMANDTLDSLAGTVQDLRHQAEPLLNRASHQAAALAQLGADAVHDGARHVRDTAGQARDTTVSYIRDEPVKAMLIAAATGAALMALISLIGRSASRD
jgi:ElaB/YqjD/DUF883 family membrane-anchored ribosome-binding protein